MTLKTWPQKILLKREHMVVSITVFLRVNGKLRVKLEVKPMVDGKSITRGTWRVGERLSRVPGGMEMIFFKILICLLSSHLLWWLLAITLHDGEEKSKRNKSRWPGFILLNQTSTDERMKPAYCSSLWPALTTSIIYNNNLRRSSIFILSF